MIKTLCNGVAFGALLLGALGAAAQEPTDLLMKPEPAIEISETRQLSVSALGLQDRASLDLPAALFAKVKPAALTSLYDGIPMTIGSETLRSIAIRLLATESDVVSDDDALLLTRVRALLRLGQPELAANLLAVVPNGSKDMDYHQLAFELKAARGAEMAEICGEAEARLSETPDAWWQRWVILCQARRGESEKAELGMALLREQNEVSEFFESVLEFALVAEPVRPLPARLTLQQIGWLKLVEGKEFLNESIKGDDFRAISLLATNEGEQAEQWKKLMREYKLGMTKVPTSTHTFFRPNVSDMVLSEDADESKHYKAFLAYALRKALDQPVTKQAEKALQGKTLHSEFTILAPVWYEKVQTMLNDERHGELLLLLVSLFHEPLHRYAPHDIANMVKILMSLGMEKDAMMLSKEATEAAYSNR